MTRDTRGFLVYIAPALAYAALLFWISSLPQPDAPDYGLEWGDKVNHAGAFAIMTVLWYRAGSWLFPQTSPGRRLGIVVLIVMLYGATDEIHQSFVPGRFADFYDWLADAIGALLAAVVIRVIPPSSRLHRLLFYPARATARR